MRVLSLRGLAAALETGNPAPEVFANSVLDPAIGIGGELGMAAFATADWRNWRGLISRLATFMTAF